MRPELRTRPSLIEAAPDSAQRRATENGHRDRRASNEFEKSPRQHRCRFRALLPNVGFAAGPRPFPCPAVCRDADCSPIRAAVLARICDPATVRSRRGQRPRSTHRPRDHARSSTVGSDRNRSSTRPLRHLTDSGEAAHLAPGTPGRAIRTPLLTPARQTSDSDPVTHEIHPLERRDAKWSGPVPARQGAVR